MISKQYNLSKYTVHFKNIKVNQVQYQKQKLVTKKHIYSNNNPFAQKTELKPDKYCKIFSKSIINVGLSLEDNRVYYVYISVYRLSG